MPDRLPDVPVSYTHLALGNSVSQEIVRIDTIDELCQCIQNENVKYLFYGIENKFSEKLKILIQKKIA